MADLDVLREIELQIRSHHTLLILETAEAERIQTLFGQAAERLDMPLFVWTPTKGLYRVEDDLAIEGTIEPGDAFAHVAGRKSSGLYFFRGLGPHLEDPLVVGRLADAAQAIGAGRRFDDYPGGAVVIAERGVRLPEAVRAMSATIDPSSLDPVELASFVDGLLAGFAQQRRFRVLLTDAEAGRMLQALRGLTRMEVEKLLTQAVQEDGKLTAGDIEAILRTKKTLLDRDGLLEFVPVPESMGEVAGLGGLKDWLDQRKRFLTDPEVAAKFGLTFPKGVLLLGVQGCGKSLCAKAVAREWGLPLFKLDPTNLYSKYAGESEKNFRQAMRIAEAMAPVVLWIDEIEKAFAAGAGTEDGAVSRRIFGTFLAWMQDRRGDVFLVATANDISRLPPEFLRKGRFDEIFFVDLPNTESRRAVFEIHLRRRKQDPNRFDLDALAAAADRFSGAEIEQAVIAGLYTAFNAGTGLTPAILAAEIAKTKPLAVTMSETVTALRDWARGRTVEAG